MVSRPSIGNGDCGTPRDTNVIANAGFATTARVLSPHRVDAARRSALFIGGNVTSRITRVIRAVGTAALAASSAVNVACYRYSPIDSSPSTMVGADMRVRLTDAGAVTLAPLVGNRVELVDGRLASVADTSLTLSVTGTTDRLGNETPWRGEEVVIPRTLVAGVELRTLDRGKSYLVGGITAGLVAVVGIGFSMNGGGGGDRGSSPSVPK